MHKKSQLHKAKPNNRKALLSWDRSLICREFGMDSRTVGKRLADAELDDKERFTTKEVFTAMHGDLGAERIGETRARRIKLELENAEKMGELIPVAELIARLSKPLTSVRSMVLTDVRLEDDQKESILREISGMLEAALAGGGPDADASTKADSQPVG